MGHVQTMNVGEYVAVVLRVHSAVEATSATGEPYLTVRGVDMDGVSVPSLRLWRFADGDAGAHCFYIFRGLKIVQETYSDTRNSRRVPSNDGRMTVECNFKMAAEDVTNANEIARYF